MKFEQSCYIQKNTPELRKALEDLGYKYRGRSSEYGELGSLYCFDGYYWEVWENQQGTIALSIVEIVRVIFKSCSSQG